MNAQATTPHAPLLLKLAVVAALAFLYVPFLVILLYAFSTEDATFTFPPPGLTLDWFGVAWGRPDICHNISCAVLGAGRLIDVVERKCGIHPGETSADGLFTLKGVECSAACG